MKLKRDRWNNVKMLDVCELINGRAYSAHELLSEGTPVLRVGNFFTNDKWYYSNLNLEEKKYCDYGDLLYAWSASFGPRIWQGEKVIFHYHIWKVDVSDKIIKQFLYYVLENETVKIKAASHGTTMPHITKTAMEKHSIPLPPLEEQKQIAALFQSIETAMEQVDGQEKNLKALWKRLINELVSDKPCFGNLLKGKKLKIYNYSDVTEKLMRKIDPLTYDIERIVAGENLESEDFKIRTWQKVGEGYLGPAFHVLFKSRRTYLRKVSHADFEGVCANTTYVIKANEELLLQDLLKHIMLSERFTQYSIGVSKGSTNPYINWKDLDNFSFQVPDLETQKEIVNVLDGILAIVEQLKQQKATLQSLKQKLLNEILG
jgi:restriction endonuclease S subunit